MPDTTKQCAVGDIPFWKGAQAAPEIDNHPFTFERDPAGMIRQIQSSAAEAAIASYASDDYYFQTSPPGSSEWGNHLAQLSLDGVRRTCGDISGLDVLEVGGGTLYNAQYYIHEMGAASVSLVDPAVQEKPDNDQITVYRQYFTAETDLGRKFPIIISLNVLEHVPDPEDFLRAVRNNLSDDGRVFLKMPECEDSLRQGDLGLCVHEHISYFTPNSLDTLMKRTGLERVSEANYLGALQVVARKAEADPSAVCESTKPLLEQFERNFQANLQRLDEFAEQNKGGKAAFIGASAGLANVLNLSTICEKMDIDVFDSDSLKTGRYLPGIKKSIHHINDDLLEGFDAIFISPVNFHDEIAASLRQRPALKDAKIMPVFLQAG